MTNALLRHGVMSVEGANQFENRPALTIFSYYYIENKK